MNKILKIAAYLVLTLALVLVSALLFFEKEIKDLLDERGLIDNKTAQADILRIAYPEEATVLNPLKLEPAARNRLINVYEPLVRSDQNFRIKPALALSWGLVDDTVWELKLRPGVKFHDGSDFDAEDVRASFKAAIENQDSEVKGILGTVKGLQKVDDLTVRIITKEPDPLLLQRISNLAIFPSEMTDLSSDKQIGTGPYKLDGWLPNEKTLYSLNEDYWGEIGSYKKVELLTVSDKVQRARSLVRGDADFLAYLPYDAVDYINENNLDIEAVPSLEVQFLVFNLQSEILGDLRNREALSLVINQEELVKNIGNYAKPVNQFVSSGVFGFNPGLKEHEYDLDKAKKLAIETGLDKETVQIHLLKGLEVLGEHLRIQLSKIGVDAVISYLELADLFKNISENKGDVYFLAMKADIGDSASFINDIAYSKAEFNVGSYKNDEMDKLVESSNLEMDVKKRQDQLYRAMEIAVKDDPLGVPLFEFETLYAFAPWLQFEPRLDGQLYFENIKIKNEN